MAGTISHGNVITSYSIHYTKLYEQFNFNLVRISHYPPVNKYLELADEYGLFIVDEVGDECHATQYVSDMPEYAEMYRDRTRKTVLRDRNHPSILFWSAGNEAGEGENITEVVKEGKRLDPTRYWMYGGNDMVHPAEDIIGPRYPSVITSYSIHYTKLYEAITTISSMYIHFSFGNELVNPGSIFHPIYIEIFPKCGGPQIKHSSPIFPYIVKSALIVSGLSLGNEHVIAIKG